jgi:tetratricopeptide (TPR) repeat protein
VRRVLASLLPNRSMPALESTIADLKAAVAESSRWSLDRFLAAAEAGDEASLQRMMSAVTAAPAAAAAAAAAAMDVSPPVVQHALSAALHRACRGGHASVAKTLLAAGAALGHHSGEDGLFQSVLHAAAAGGHEPVVRLLLGKEGVDVDERDAYRRTALHLAAAGNHGAVVKFLLLNGGDPTLRDVHGMRAAEVAKGTHDWAPADAAVAAGAPDCFSSGELGRNPPAPAAAKVLSDANVLFWNASVRANKYYNLKAFERAIEAYSDALELAPQCSMVRGSLSARVRLRRGDSTERGGAAR